MSEAVKYIGVNGQNPDLGSEASRDSIWAEESASSSTLGGSMGQRSLKAEVEALIERNGIDDDDQNLLRELLSQAGAKANGDASLSSSSSLIRHRRPSEDHEDEWASDYEDRRSPLESGLPHGPISIIEPGSGVAPAPDGVAAESTTTVDLAESPPMPPQYQDLGRIGIGGTGEVRRVLDRKLNRAVAMKLLHVHLHDDEPAVGRFLEEAQVTAQLQHPGILPVHDVGRLPDGRRYFTMKVVTGRTLRDVIQDVRKGASSGSWQVSNTEWTLRRVISTFRRICEAVAYSHACGVVHRDLKPTNIMVGGFGEILVVDWGVAKVKGHPDAAVNLKPTDGMPLVCTVRTIRADDDPMTTDAGIIPGTPAYMPMEQTAGEVDRIGPPTDVYALGVILYEILSGGMPYPGKTSIDIMRMMLMGTPKSVQQTATENGGAPVPAALQELCHWCLSKEPEDRPSDASVLVERVGAWLEGAERREQALKVVKTADELKPDINLKRQLMTQLKQEAERCLGRVRPHEPVENKLKGWSLEDRAGALEREIMLAEARYVHSLRSALNLDPELVEAHQRLAGHYCRQHHQAEAERDPLMAEQLALLIEEHDRSGHYSAYLKGHGAVTLVTDPPGAEVLLFEYQLQNRRLVPAPVQHLGVTPLRKVSLPRGSYLMVIRAPGRVDVRYPIFIERGEHWDGIRPGDSEPLPIRLPRVQEMSSTDAYVPPGWTRVGGDAMASNSLPKARVWVDGFVVRRYPVTNEEFLTFLNTLWVQNREAEALKWIPRERPGGVTGLGAMIYGREGSGRFLLRSDSDGHQWDKHAPVLMVDWLSAGACAEWCQERTGKGWRLPWELEWEKAAGGVDGRIYPWGDFVDPNWSCIRDSHQGVPHPAKVTQYPLDESVYGARGMGGNVMDWCMDVFTKKGYANLEGSLFDPAALPRGGENALRVTRGGSWYGNETNCRVARRNADLPSFRSPFLGIRLVRSF